MRWGCLEVMNGIRECSRNMTEAQQSYNTALQRVMIYILKTRDIGLVLTPYGIWDEGRNFLCEIQGISDSDYAKDESRHIVNV